ncbi:MAG: transglutaminase domain-containing protein [Candidatus Bathyarchaeia archaeon]
METKHLTILLITVLLAQAFPMDVLGLDEVDSNFLKYEVGEVFVGELRHVIQIINPWQNAATGKLVVPLVNNRTSYHYTVLYNFSAEGGRFSSSRFLNDSFRNVYLCWENVEIPPRKNFTIELDYFVISFSVRYMVNPSLVGSYDVNSELYRRYIEPEKLIQSDNPEIVRTAQTIVGDEENPHKKAVLIYAFVTKHLKYEVQSEEKGALWALENRKGDCSEYSYLFVALCRAVGIPARVQAGFAFHYVNEVIENGHMWAEYYLENYGWIPADATWKMFDQIDYRHVSSIQSIPEVMPYANFHFESAGGRRLEDKQRIQLKRVSTSKFSDSQFAEKIMAAIQMVKQAEFGASIGKILGVKFLFPSEIDNVEHKILECKVYIQNAVDAWSESSQIATGNAAEAIKIAEEAYKHYWMLIAKVFTLYFIIALVLIAISLALSRRSSRKLVPSISHIASLS